MGKPTIPDTGHVGEALLEQALARASRRQQERQEHTQEGADPRGRVFPGNMPGPATQTAASRKTRSGTRAKRKVSPFTVVVALVLMAVASVLYISNVIAVSRLAAEIGELEQRYKTVLNEQEMVRAQLARLSGLERIRRIAEDQYGMQNSDAVPGWLTVDEARVEELKRLADIAGTGTER